MMSLAAICTQSFHGDSIHMNMDIEPYHTLCTAAVFNPVQFQAYQIIGYFPVIWWI